MTVTSQVTREPKPDIYANSEARKILEYLIWNPGTILSPSILPTDQISYLQVESILGKEPSEEKSIQLLKAMTEANVLAAELVDKVPTCPTSVQNS
jgi:hypothetical protein